MKRLGRVPITEKLLLEWLQLEDGRILGAEVGSTHGTVELLIEHPEMPLVKTGTVVPRVLLTFTSRYNEKGERVVFMREPIV